MGELFDYLTGRTVLRTFVQYLITFCSRPKTDSDVISDVVVDPTGMKVSVKLFGDSRPNRSRDIRLTQMRDERRRHWPTPVITQGPNNNLRHHHHLVLLPNPGAGSHFAVPQRAAG